jgi:hypothetical protein
VIPHEFFEALARARRLLRSGKPLDEIDREAFAQILDCYESVVIQFDDICARFTGEP